MHPDPTTGHLPATNLPTATPIAFDTERSQRRASLTYNANRAATLLATSRVEPQPGIIDPSLVGSQGSVADMSGLPVGDAATNGQATTLALRSVHSDQSAWGASAADYLASGEFAMHDLPRSRRRERDLVAGIARGTPVLMTNSSHSSQGAGLAGIALLEGHAHEGDQMYVLGRTLVRFDEPLPTQRHRRPVGLRGDQSGFGGTFHAVPIVAPCTPGDLVSLMRVLDLPHDVLVGDPEQRMAALQEWARRADLAKISQRWHHEANYATPPDPRRVLLGGAAQMIGRMGELIVTDLLEAWSSTSTAVVDVTAVPDLGHDLEVRPMRVAERFHVEVKATSEVLTHPLLWVRHLDRLTPTQRRSAEASLQRGQVPWYCAVVNSALSTTPTVTFFSAADVLAHRRKP